MAQEVKNPVRQRNLLSVLGLIAIAVLFIAVVIFSNQLFRSARLDLTENKLYTLSDGTREVLHEIDEPIRLRFYYSERITEELPDVGVYAQRVRDMLEEYAALADGEIRLEIVDPQPFTDEEDHAVAVGIQGVPIDQGGDLVYFGLSGTNSTDDQQVIPYFDQQREALLEYDLTKLVYNLSNPEKPKVAVMSGLPIAGSPYARQMPGAPDDSWVVWRELNDQFDVEQIGQQNATIPTDADLLLVIQPDQIDDRSRYAIDQYAMRGGKVIVLVDPHSEVAAAEPSRRRGPSPYVEAGSNLPKLLNAWGLEMPPEDVIGDAALARRVQVPTADQNAASSRVAAIDYPMWLALTPDQLNQQDPVTSQLSRLNFASPGQLKPVEGAATTFTPLITTTEQGGVGDLALAQQGSLKVLEQTNRFTPDGKHVLAARISGPVNSAFPDGPPKPPMIDQLEKSIANAKPEEDVSKKKEELAKEQKQWEEAKAAFIAQSQKPLNAIVIADVDFLTDGLWVRVQDFFGQKVANPYAQNGNLLINAVDNMVGSEALISLRSRGAFQRPFTLIQDIQRDAEQQFRAKEQELLKQLNETQQRLSQLQSDPRGEGSVVLTQEQRDEIDRFREESVRIRRELRDVQYQLRANVDRVSSWVRAINIAAVPVLVALFAIVLALTRRSMRRCAVRA
jgi:ABC-type uncharacterized transport system involved in gliding motility auxiliary subunit